MPLLSTVTADFVEIMNDEDTGGVACTITNPAGDSLPFNALHSDVHQALDINGEIITGRQAHVTVIESELITAGFGDIRNVTENDARPWLVTVADANGREETLKVAESLPDRGLGRMTLRLEVYAALES